MITLKNKQTKINIVSPRGETIEKAKYSDIIELCVNQPEVGPQGPTGFSIEDIRKRLRVVDSLKSTNGEIKMEDADYEVVVNAVTSYKWMAVDQMIVDFVDDVEKANK